MAVVGLAQGTEAGAAFAGLVAWWRRPHNRLGPLMIAAGFGVFLSSWRRTSWPPRR